jgi:hypothetical protein
VLSALLPTFLIAARSAADVSAPIAFPQFRVQEIDKSLTVGYGVKLVDINGDGRPDIVVADSARVIWFENPGADPLAGADAPWKLHTILQDKDAGLKVDNVCIDAWDIDGDGKVDLVLGADWQPGNTNGGGSLLWLSRGKTLDEPWTVHPILSTLPTLHRAHFGDLDGTGRPKLIVGPLKGTGSTAAKNFTDVGSRLLVFDIPKDPVNGKWEERVLTDDLHVLHNFLAVPTMDARTGYSVPGVQARQVLTASYEGVNLLTPTSDGKATLTHLGAGNQDNPKASRGSSEIKVGHLKNGTTFLATIEPFHGNQVVIYTPPPLPREKADPGTLWTRTVLDEDLKAGHAVWCADLDGDGNDEVIVGWREGAHTGIRLYKSTGASNDAKPWVSSDLDSGGVAVEDLAAADLDGDGRIDLVAVGRATHNVRIYWNDGDGHRRR